MANIKKGDLVQVISGRSQARGGDRGKQGKVIEVLVAESGRVSMMRTRSPTPAELASSWTLILLLRRRTLP